MIFIILIYNYIENNNCLFVLCFISKYICTTCRKYHKIIKYSAYYIIIFIKKFKTFMK